ncbi:12193_t:CDS:2 [Dentiscutata erythropus]|uniref:12193_t:CDS:1 n=1 Tax=Dentiscutata erythropus TaxID=1348616 RepID=A0A9N8Z6K8_9GLOM|nr:12193_t:CDS:2 [Dentiscutata erythropus]
MTKSMDKHGALDSQYTEQILTNHHPKPTLLYCTPPPSPMTNNLGHPNRSCSKHRCQYTSYSPPEEPLPSVPEDDTMRQHWIQNNQRMNQDVKLQPTVIKNEYDFLNDNSILGMNIDNSAMPLLVSGPQYAPVRYQQQQLAQLQQNLVQPSYMLPQQCQQIPQSSIINRNIYNSVMQPMQSVPSVSDNYMRGTITLNYNLNGLLQVMGPAYATILQSVTKGTGPVIPPTGFSSVQQLQYWIREKILALSQEWIGDIEQPYVFDPEEKLKLRLIDDEQQGQYSYDSYVLRHQFDVIIDRAEYSGDNFDPQTGDYKPFDDLNQYDDDDRFSGNSNRSSIDIDPSDIFLQKLYAFVRKFMKDVPWLRENFMMSICRDYDTVSDGGISDVAVEIRKNQSSPLLYSQQQNRQTFAMNNDIYDSQSDIVKGRLCF